jgi:hypothetical protein
LDRRGGAARIEKFFQDRAGARFDGRAVAVFAHPDDETVAFGGQLNRIEAHVEMRCDELEASLEVLRRLVASVGPPPLRAIPGGRTDSGPKRRARA